MQAWSLAGSRWPQCVIVLPCSVYEGCVLCVSTEKAPLGDYFLLGKPSIIAKQSV